MLIRDSMPLAWMRPTRAAAPPPPASDSFAPSSLSTFDRRPPTPLADPAFNTFNQDVLRLLDKHPDPAWKLFALTNQNYCSPSVPSPNTVYQGGVLQFSQHIKYQRSEMNTPVFGETYDRHTVMIRSQSRDAFRELACGYIVSADAKAQCRFEPGRLSLTQFLSTGDNARRMVEVPLESRDFPAFLPQLRDAFASGFDNGVYVSLKGSLRPEQRAALDDALKASGTKMQVVLDEDYDPYATGRSDFQKITLLHDGNDKLRYQLLQDGASMGFRPQPPEVLAYAESAGKIPSLLDTGTAAASVLAAQRPERPVEGHSLRERDRDFRLLRATVAPLLHQLEALRPTDPLRSQLLASTRELTSGIARDLDRVLGNPDTDLRVVADTFHSACARLRTAIQYTVHLSQELQPLSRQDLQRRMESFEGGRVLATNSGMAATRTVLTELVPRHEQVISTPHYWETDFLLENLAGHNPHYPQAGNDVKLSTVKADADPVQLVDRVVRDGKSTLLCLDRSISPFFYTEHFDLEGFTAELARRSGELRQPVTLVVDNTLDFAQVTAQKLFPDGVPPNVTLIFTPSMAKLHQMGLDLTPGGMINLHNAPESLTRQLDARLEREGSAQKAENLRLLDHTFYAHHAQGTMPEYLDFMVGKRQRNTGALLEHVARGLGQPEPKDELELGKVSVDGHDVELSLHYDPQSAMHAYLKILEAPSEKGYIAGPLFNEIKRRVFQRAAAEGIVLADGTSWGFPTTRMDHYMHTLRIAVGLEHEKTLQRIGTLMASVVKELKTHPEDFLKGTEVLPLSPGLTNAHGDEILALDRLIPHDPKNPTPLSTYQLKDWDYSYALRDQGKLTAVALAYPRGEGEIYLSKAATAPEAQGKGHFKRLLDNLRDRARSEGHDRIVLQTSASPRNERVVRAYEKCGFEVTGLKASMSADGWPLVLVEMALPVNGEATPPEQPFAPLGDALYAEVKQKGDLSAVERVAVERGLGFE